MGILMLPAFVKKTASLLVAFILAVAVIFPCGEVEAVGMEERPAVAFVDLGQDNEDPCQGDPCHKCPDADHSDSENCSCSCSCHPPIMTGSPAIYVRAFVISHASVEPFSALPEVYIPKFIPPQNAA